MIPAAKRVAGCRAAIMVSLVSALTFLPVPARAQFGGLGNRVRGAVEQKVENRVEEELPYTRLPAPEFNERVLQITDSRLDGLLRGFAAEVDYAEEAGAEYEAQRRAHDAAMTEYDRSMEAYTSQKESYDACSERFDQQEAQAQAANDAAVQKALDEMGDDEFAAYVEALAMRGQQLARDMQSSNGPPSDELMRRQQEYTAAVNAMQVEQSRRIQLAMDGMAVEAKRSATEQARLDAACGAEPQPPVMPGDLIGEDGLLSQRGARAANVTTEQYAIMRERVAYWMSQNGRPTGMGFSDQEMAALSEKKEALEQALDDMRDADVPY
jgi:hypothetical protein